VDDNNIFVGVEKESDHYTFRVWLDTSSDFTVTNMLELIRYYNCQYEIYSHKLWSIDCATHAVADDVADALANLERQGFLQYETGRTC
jgi:hypothetical protein